MITKKYLQEQMKRIETNYGANKFTVTQQMFDLWYEMFADYDPKGLKAAIDKYMKSSEFAPNVASINNTYQKLADEREHLERVIIAKYKWVAHWFEEQPNIESYNAFMNYVCKFPVSAREGVAENLALKAVQYWNNCCENGVPEQARFTVKEYVEKLNER